MRIVFLVTFVDANSIIYVMTVLVTLLIFVVAIIVMVVAIARLKVPLRALFARRVHENQLQN